MGLLLGGLLFPISRLVGYVVARVPGWGLLPPMFEVILGLAISGLIAASEIGRAHV